MSRPDLDPDHPATAAPVDSVPRSRRGPTRPPLPRADGSEHDERPPGPSAKPAFIVLGLALVIFVGGSIALGLGPSTAPTSAPTTARIVAGAKLRAVPASTLLSALRSGGQPPADIVDALALPAGSTVVPGSIHDHGVETYDRSLGLRVDASQADVITFFRAELRADGWQQISTAPSRTAAGVEILGQHGSIDGNLWEIGVVVSPSQFATAATATTDITPYSVELYVRSLSA
ncbi:MAG: hypothetical protein M0013_14520 [Actinomycetota bacterium]|nr:hypothetical protein [Actinomycetota bacterium]